MYLLDTNVWLERLLDQENSDNVGVFLERVSTNLIFITDFSLHSICIILTRFSRSGILIDFVQDLFVNGAVGVVALGPEAVPAIVQTMNDFGLDFDDGYQYVAAEQRSLAIISFDSDFDTTTLGRKTPAQILAET